MDGVYFIYVGDRYVMSDIGCIFEHKCRICWYVWERRHLTFTQFNGNWSFRRVGGYHGMENAVNKYILCIFGAKSGKNENDNAITEERGRRYEP